MKGLTKTIPLLIASSLQFGCASTESNSIDNEVVKYDSRCGIHSFTVEENLENSKHANLLSTKPPKYPIEAVRNRQEGYVKLEFDISEDGKPININVIESMPAKVFDQAAIYSFKSWQYEQIASTCNSIQLDFKFG